MHTHHINNNQRARHADNTRRNWTSSASLCFTLHGALFICIDQNTIWSHSVSRGKYNITLFLRLWWLTAENTYTHQKDLQCLRFYIAVVLMKDMVHNRVLQPSFFCLSFACVLACFNLVTSTNQTTWGKVFHMKPILMQTFTETLTRLDRKNGSIVLKKKYFIYLFVYLFI